jgi:hypothetical protein
MGRFWFCEWSSGKFNRRIFKETAENSPSPWGEGRDEGGSCVYCALLLDRNLNAKHTHKQEKGQPSIFMWELINALGWVGWMIGAVCLVALIWQRNENQKREKREAAEKEKADKKDAA